MACLSVFIWHYNQIDQFIFSLFITQIMWKCSQTIIQKLVKPIKVVRLKVLTFGSLFNFILRSILTSSFYTCLWRAAVHPRRRRREGRTSMFPRCDAWPRTLWSSGHTPSCSELCQDQSSRRRWCRRGVVGQTGKKILLLLFIHVFKLAKLFLSYTCQCCSILELKS